MIDTFCSFSSDRLSNRPNLWPNGYEWLWVENWMCLLLYTTYATTIYCLLELIVKQLLKKCFPSITSFVQGTRSGFKPVNISLVTFLSIFHLIAYLLGDLPPLRGPPVVLAILILFLLPLYCDGMLRQEGVSTHGSADYILGPGGFEAPPKTAYLNHEMACLQGEVNVLRREIIKERGLNTHTDYRALC